MNENTELFDLEERQPNDKMPGGRTWCFQGSDFMTIKYSEMWDPALVMHEHPEEQVNLVIGGRAIFRVGDKDYELHRGCIIRIPPNQPHGLVKKLSRENFQVIQLVAPAQRQTPESLRTDDNGNEGWPGL